MAMDEVLTTRNPATGAEVGRVKLTPPESLPGIVARARQAQRTWSQTSWKERRGVLKEWRGILSRDAAKLADVIRDEIGKPRIEALTGDVLSSLDGILWTIKHGRRALAERRIGAGWQRWLLMPTARLRWCPIGVVGMIGTWNYPFYLNAPPIAQALAAGNAVVWKPSELAVLCGQRLLDSLAEAGVPAGLVMPVWGGGEVGKALVESGIDKGMFTGGVPSGRLVLSGLGARGIPALAELSGFDPAIILPGAPLKSTTRALTWAAFVGCGQTCVAVKRIYVVGEALPWAEALAESARGLKVGDPGDPGVDVGPLISEAARERFDRMIQAAVKAGARVLAGGRAAGGPGWFYPPTVLYTSSPEPEAALAGAFGPVVVVRGVHDDDDAIDAANSGEFGLAASVWAGRWSRRAQRVASRLQAGSVSINDAVTPTAHAAAPFGGIKASGFGRTHGVIGIREFAQPQATFSRGPGGYRPQLFPYQDSARIEKFLAMYRRWFHPEA